MTLYDKLHDRWHDKAEQRAMKDPRYVEIESLIRTENGLYRWTGNEHLRKEQNEIFNRITPRPFYLRASRYLEHRHLTPHWLKFRAKMFVQRGQRGWSERDVWGFDHYLNKVMVGAIGELRANNHGYPAEFADLGGNLQDEGEFIWAAILTAIIEGFEAAQYIVDELPMGDEYLSQKATFDLGFELFHEYYFDLWD